MGWVRRVPGESSFHNKALIKKFVELVWLLYAPKADTELISASGRGCVESIRNKDTSLKAETICSSPCGEGVLQTEGSTTNTTTPIGSSTLATTM